MTRVAVLTGGSTPERDVALAGATQVVSALRAAGFDVTVVDTVSGVLSPEREAELLTGAVQREAPTTAQLAALKQRELGPRLTQLPEVRAADVVFPVLHGRDGEGGELQDFLGQAGLPFTGSDAVGSRMAMAKDLAKERFRSIGLATPDWAMWPVSKVRLEQFGLPLIVKPSRVGSTIGLSLVESRDEIEAAVERAARYDDDVMVERFVRGRELTVGVLGDTPLAVGEILPKHVVFDYECKYTPGMSKEIFPADLSEVETARLKNDALRAHRVLSLRDMSRVDFILTPDQTAYCLEVNTLPGLAPTSLLPQSAAAAGIGFGELCTRLCEMAMRRSEGTKATSKGS